MSDGRTLDVDGTGSADGLKFKAGIGGVDCGDGAAGDSAGDKDSFKGCLGDFLAGKIALPLPPSDDMGVIG